MAYFPKITEIKQMTPEQLKRESDLSTMRMLRRDADEKGQELRKELPLPIIPIPFDHSIWKRFFDLHQLLWKTYYSPVKDDRMFIYHLCLANLAALISEVEDENKMIVQNALVFLRFGEDHPNLNSHMDSLLAPVLSFNERKDWRKRDPLDVIRNAVRCVGKPYRGNIHFEGNYEEVVKQYIDGCIAILSNIITIATFSQQYDVPKEYDEKRHRDKTLGDFVDDYFTMLASK